MDLKALYQVKERQEEKDNPEQLNLDYTNEMLAAHFALLEDHLLNIASDRNVMQCLSCSDWHLRKIIYYDSLERSKFDPNYFSQDGKVIRWAEKVREELPDLVVDKEKAKQRALEAREFRYYFAGDEAELPLSQLDYLCQERDLTEEEIKKEIEEVSAKIEALEDYLEREPARKLIYIIPRRGWLKGEITALTKRQFRDLLGYDPPQAVLRKYDKVEKVPWEYALDQLASEMGYKSDEELKKAIEECRRKNLELEKLYSELGYLKTLLKEAKERPPEVEVVGSVAECPLTVPEYCRAEVYHVDGHYIWLVRQPSTWLGYYLLEGEEIDFDKPDFRARYAKEARKKAKQVAEELKGVLHGEKYPGATVPVPIKYAKYRVETRLVRSKRWPPELQEAITSPEKAREVAEKIEGSDRERALVLYLDTRNKLNGIQELAIGEREASLVPRDVIFRTALLTNSSGFIMIHNHPSGEVTPSGADINTANILREGAKLLDMQLLDFMIVGDGKYYSFREEGRL